jgi:hypothetical protein
MDTNETPRARIKYHAGALLVIPKNGFAPALFMEWLARTCPEGAHITIDEAEDFEGPELQIRIKQRQIRMRIGEALNL